MEKLRNIIFGTDWGEDCDDCVAARVLARSHNAGRINLLGAGINTRTPDAAPSLYAFLEKETCIIPVGVDKSCPKSDWQNRYQPRLASYTDKKDEDFPDAVRLYRQLIANAEGKVEIIEVGFLQVLAGAIMSGPDDISPKTGKELFSEKVDKVWIMGGKYVNQGDCEFNFSYTPFACEASSYVLANCPSPITLLGWEIGAGVYTGNTLSPGDHLYDALKDWGCTIGRESWDPMTALMTVIGDEEKAGYDTVPCDFSVDPKTGSNYFTENPSSKNVYVKKKFPDSYYIDAINKMIE